MFVGGSAFAFDQLIGLAELAGLVVAEIVDAFYTELGVYDSGKGAKTAPTRADREYPHEWYNLAILPNCQTANPRADVSVVQIALLASLF